MVKKFTSNFSRNKIGLSGVVTVVILVALVLSATIIVWGVVDNIVNREKEKTESCFLITDKEVGIDRDYTCYNSSSQEVRFKLSIGDIEIDQVLVSISWSTSSEGFKILNRDSNVDELYNYPDKIGEVFLPDKNSGKTYIYELGSTFVYPVTSIEIAPVIDDNQCPTSDVMLEISDCTTSI